MLKDTNQKLINKITKEYIFKVANDLYRLNNNNVVTYPNATVLMATTNSNQLGARKSLIKLGFKSSETFPSIHRYPNGQNIMIHWVETIKIIKLQQQLEKKSLQRKKLYLKKKQLKYYEDYLLKLYLPQGDYKSD